MKILKRTGRQKSWSKVNQVKYRKESELQNLLYGDPRIIPVSEISEERKEIKVPIKEFGLPGSGSSDIIGMDESGNIYIIETKLAVNPEIKRKVIGQILEYAAFLWKMSFQNFDIRIQGREKKSLIGLMREQVDSPDWSEENFRQNIEVNLLEGNFTLIIVVDEINDDLRRILEFINSKSFTGPQIYALEARYYSDEDGVELIIPTLYGTSIKDKEVREDNRITRKWDEPSFFAEIEKNLSKIEVKIIKKILDFFTEVGKVDFGSGAKTGSFGVANNSRFIWYVDTNGRCTLPIGWLINYPKISKKQLEPLVKIVKKLSDNFDDSRDWASYYPNFMVKKLSDSILWAEFTRATKTFIKNADFTE